MVHNMWLNQEKRVETNSEEETALCVYAQFNLRLHGPGRPTCCFVLTQMCMAACGWRLLHSTVKWICKTPFSWLQFKTFSKSTACKLCFYHSTAFVLITLNSTHPRFPSCLPQNTSQIKVAICRWLVFFPQCCIQTTKCCLTKCSCISCYWIGDTMAVTAFRTTGTAFVWGIQPQFHPHRMKQAHCAT